MPPLTEARIRAIAPESKTRRYADSGGLYLEVAPGGQKYWRLKYRHAGKEKRLALGVYPSVSLAHARSGRDRAKAQLQAGTDPSQAKRAHRLTGEAVVTFRGIAEEWIARKRLAPATMTKKRWILDDLLNPYLGDKPIASITPPDLLAVLRRIESRGALETAHRAKQQAGEVFRYAIATGRATVDPSSPLKGAIAPVQARSHAALTEPTAVGALLRAIDGYQGQAATCAALRLAPLVFVRPGELRQAEWSEFDLAEAVWRIPAEKMKMREAHLVPLSRQALAILTDQHMLTGRGRYVFPAMTRQGRCLSENTINGALRALGYDNAAMTGHGFRAMASTLLNELDFRPDVIERQLAHKERNKVRGIYNRAQYLPERRAMMQAWADYLDTLRQRA